MKFTLELNMLHLQLAQQLIGLTSHLVITEPF